jgi:hypothetical protein
LKEEGLEVWPLQENVTPATRTQEIVISKETIGNDQEYRNFLDLLHRCFKEGCAEIHLYSKDLNYATFREVCDSLNRKGFLVDYEKIYYQNGMMYAKVRRKN